MIRQAILLGLSVLLLQGCRQDEPKPAGPVIPPADAKTLLLERARKLGGPETGTVVLGEFAPGDSGVFGAVKEINSATVWGIQFWFGKVDTQHNAVLWQSAIREGSITQADITSVRLSEMPYDLLSYNSADYFMGSAGGEVFAYLVDCNQKAVYYAHLTMDKLNGISLYLAPKQMPAPVKAYFIRSMRSDYPDLKLVTSDSGD